MWSYNVSNYFRTALTFYFIFICRFLNVRKPRIENLLLSCFVINVHFSFLCVLIDKVLFIWKYLIIFICFNFIYKFSSLFLLLASLFLFLFCETWIKRVVYAPFPYEIEFASKIALKIIIILKCKFCDKATCVQKLQFV